MLNNRLVPFALALFLISGLSLCFPPKACRATWFLPIGFHVMPIALSENQCTPDTSGYFLPGQSVGFAIHFQVAYVLEAAIEPGILGISDSLTHFSVAMLDSTQQWHDVTTHFLYGLPRGCEGLQWAGATGQTYGRGSWFYAAPEGLGDELDIRTFMHLFNQIGHQNTHPKSAFPQTGLQVDHSVFTFWAKNSWVKSYSKLHLKLTFETASGKKMTPEVHLLPPPDTLKATNFLEK